MRLDFRPRVLHVAGALLAVSAVAAGCRGTRDDASVATTTHAATQAPLRKVPLVVPSEIPPGERGDLVRYGRVVATRTSEELPDVVGSALHCSSCHLGAGTVAGAGPWVGLTQAYPVYRARAGKMVSLEDRIDECFERSMNGKPLPHDAKPVRALVAYVDWLSEGVPRGAEVEGRGFERLEAPPVVDRAHGKDAYEARCASCHGEDGAGRASERGEYLFPPVWGDRSFNVGAGMARLDTAAAFVRHNMPLGATERLTALEAYEIASYVIEQPRPDFARKNDDWPKGGKPRDARY